MPNMSYCRFQNTRPDLLDCADALDDIDGDISQLPDHEQSAAIALIELCKRIAYDHGDAV